MQAWIPIVRSSLYFCKSVFSFRVESILKWRVYIKRKVSWLRTFLCCKSQTSRDRVNSRRVRTHEKNSGVAVRRLGTIIQSLNVGKWSSESRYPGAFPLVLENFRRAFSPGPTNHPWVSEDDFAINYSIARGRILPQLRSSWPFSSWSHFKNGSSVNTHRRQIHSWGLTPKNSSALYKLKEMEYQRWILKQLKCTF